jgi:kynurenine formamidase
VKIIDLTHPLLDDQPSYPGDPTPMIKPFASLAESGYNTTRFAMGSHQGTHLDAPFHFFRDGQTVDRIPLETLYGPAVLVDLAPGGELGQGATVTDQMLESHAGAFEAGGRVLCRTGWDKHYGDPRFFENYPSLTVEAAQWIAGKKIRVLGIDTPSPAEDFADIHRILLGEGIVIVESLANLGALPREFTFIGFPLKLKGRDGSPIRAAAVLE